MVNVISVWQVRPRFTNYRVHGVAIAGKHISLYSSYGDFAEGITRDQLLANSGVVAVGAGDEITLSDRHHFLSRQDVLVTHEALLVNMLALVALSIMELRAHNLRNYIVANTLGLLVRVDINAEPQMFTMQVTAYDDGPTGWQSANFRYVGLMPAQTHLINHGRYDAWQHAELLKMAATQEFYKRIAESK